MGTRDERAVKRYCCRNCGFMVVESEFSAAAFDYDCPRCGMFSLSEFETVEIENKGTENRP